MPHPGQRKAPPSRVTQRAYLGLRSRSLQFGCLLIKDWKEIDAKGFSCVDRREGESAWAAGGEESLFNPLGLSIANGTP